MTARYGNDMRYSPYPKYKPSGVEWLGDVPNEWGVKRMKYLTSINDDVLPESTPEDLEIVYVDIGNVDYATGITGKEHIMFEDAPSRARRLVKDGDTIVSTVRTYLKAVAPIRKPERNLVVSTGFAVVRPRKVIPDYLSYCLRSTYFVERVSSISVGVSYPATNSSDVACVDIPEPGKDEQERIASFLDRETAKIDALLGKKRQLIDKLKEKRIALISRAVTRGLPSHAAKAAGLNPHPKLKPSGVEWLGEIPEHWEVKRVKTVATYRVSNVDKVPADDELPVRLCNYTDVYYNEFITPDMELMETTATLDEIERFRLHPGDVVITKDSEEWNDIAIPAFIKESSPDLLCGYHLAFIRPNPKKLAGSFLFRCFQAEGINQQFQVAASGVTRYGLPKSSIGCAWIAVPPLFEQKQIAAFVETQTAKIDQMADIAEKAIVKLQEYRTALITAGVTGKIDVRNAS